MWPLTLCSWVCDGCGFEKERAPQERHDTTGWTTTSYHTSYCSRYLAGRCSLLLCLVCVCVCVCVHVEQVTKCPRGSWAKPWPVSFFLCFQSKSTLFQKRERQKIRESCSVLSAQLYSTPWAFVITVQVTFPFISLSFFKSIHTHTITIIP